MIGANSLPFLPAFLVHVKKFVNHVRRNNSDGVIYIDVGEDGERFLVIDMVKKKAERKAKHTPVLKVPGKKKK